MEFKVKEIVGSKLVEGKFEYQVLKNILDYDGRSKCIILKAMHPDFAILIGSISLIISESGSSLSHLSIVARENDVKVVLCEKIVQKMDPIGILELKENVVRIKD